jgi:alanine racemase
VTSESGSGTAPGDWPGRPVWAEIDLDALTHNVRLLAARAGSARLLAVVKANAYGHGAVPVARAALEAGAAGLAVICVDEGEELRRAGIEAPVYVLGYSPPSEAERVASLRLVPTVASLEVAEALSRAAVAQGTTVPVQLELETGLHRHGAELEPLVALAEAARKLPGISVEGIYTHFAAAEEGDQTFTRLQHKRLMQASARLPWVTVRHCSASASILLSPDMSHELVRAGLALYGYHPSPDTATVELRRVMSLKSRLARVLRVPAGATVGYGRTWTARRASVIGLVMCGYADGLPRSLSSRANLLVRGRRAPIAGRIAMDMCMVDLTEIAAAAPGDEVAIIGEQGGAVVDADELALLAGTISWEILAGVSARVPRLYLRGGRAVSVSTLNQRLPGPPPGP